MSQNSGSGASDESIGQRNITTSVIRDTGTKVQLMFKAHGLKKRKSLLNSIVTVFKKPNSPSRLLSNGRFTKFELSAHSLCFVLEIQTEKKHKKGNTNRVDTFVCEIKQFPTGINPESAEFEFMFPYKMVDKGESVEHKAMTNDIECVMNACAFQNRKEKLGRKEI